MGYDLYGVEDDERYFRFNIFNWSKALEMAEENDWQPLGRNYYTNDGQIVSAEDAKNLADAVEKGIGNLGQSPQYAGSSASDLEYHQQHLRKFVDFCRAGAFRIY